MIDWLLSDTERLMLLGGALAFGWMIGNNRVRAAIVGLLPILGLVLVRNRANRRDDIQQERDDVSKLTDDELLDRATNPRGM